MNILVDLLLKPCEVAKDIITPILGSLDTKVTWFQAYLN